MKKVMSIFGTRPEAIKMAPLVKTIEKNKTMKSIVCITGQHREMLDTVLSLFRITPDYDLNIMKAEQSLTQVTTRVIEGLDAVIRKEMPDLILVHGDTTTAFAASLTAFYHKVKIGHVEAGLRTYDKYSPFPEEMNRQLVSRIADYHFAPTDMARQHLLKENIAAESIIVTGNTAIDALNTTIQDSFDHELIQKTGNDRMILLTVHRRESIGEPMLNIFKSIHRIVEKFEDVQIVYPVHLNPSVRNLAHQTLGGHPRIHLIEPLGVIDFHNLINKSYLVMTDSGGIQEEAPSLGKPVLVLRDITERPEGVAAGTLKIVGTDETTIYNETASLLTDPEAYSLMAKATNPYGDGQASDRIVAFIEKVINK